MDSDTLFYLSISNPGDKKNQGLISVIFVGYVKVTEKGDLKVVRSIEEACPFTLEGGVVAIQKLIPRYSYVRVEFTLTPIHTVHQSTS
jgi:hypothetical protein